MIGVLNCMPDGSRVAVDLVVISALVRFVTEEMNVRVINSTARLLCGEILQAISFVPTSREHVKRYLSTYRVATFVPRYQPKTEKKGKKGRKKKPGQKAGV